ncbi:MAG: hypothetical protein ACYTEQ_22485 [Planctomycetota bacterium]
MRVQAWDEFAEEFRNIYADVIGYHRDGLPRLVQARSYPARCLAAHLPPSRKTVEGWLDELPVRVQIR